MKRTIAIILSVVMLLSCLGISSASAASSTANIKLNGKTYTVPIKTSTVTYTLYFKAPELIENGQFSVTYPKEILSVKKAELPNINGYMINYTENVENEVKFNFSNYNGFDFTNEKILIKIEFDVIKSGSGELKLSKELVCNLNDVNILNKCTFTEAFGAQLVDIGKTDPDVEKSIFNTKSDDDLKGSTFNLLQVKNTTVKKTSIKISYKKPSGAKKFVIYGAKCGNKYKKLKTTTAKTFTLKKLKKGKYYKFLVVAVNKNNKIVATSKVIHVATKGGSVCNPKKVTITNAKKAKSIKKGKTVTLKTKVTAESKKLKLKTHRKISFESSNTKIATVTAKGKIKAKKAGTCYIYAYAQNGVMAKVKVSVKK